MKKRSKVSVLVIVTILVILFILLRKPSKSLDNFKVTTGDKISVSEKIQPTKIPEQATSDFPALADSLNSKSNTIEQDLHIVSEILLTYRTNFQNKGNPIGSNAEITLSLTGKNKFGLVLISANNKAINESGELCDRWGTPYFFHAESGIKMKIQSAGPDKKMWTKDDIEFEP